MASVEVVDAVELLTLPTLRTGTRSRRVALALRIRSRLGGSFTALVSARPCCGCRCWCRGDLITGARLLPALALTGTIDVRRT